MTAFLRRLRPGDHVWCGEGAGEPLALTRLLAECRYLVPPLTVVLGLAVCGTFGARHADRLRFRGFGGFGSNRALAEANALDIIPAGYADVAGLVRSRLLSAEVVLLQVSPPVGGTVTTGVQCGYLADVAAHARTVIAQVNPLMPRTAGDAVVPLERIDVLVDAHTELPELVLSAPAVVEPIAGHVDQIVADGATLQVGWGALPGAVVARLTGKRGLSVHTGALGDAVLHLDKAGALGDNVIRAGMIAGSRELYEFAGRDPRIEMWSYENLHRPGVIAPIEDLTAVNTAVEVDLRGQVNAESVHGREVGAVGGMLDFARATRTARAGKTVFVLPSVSGSGESRIVAELSGPATVPASLADFVVTEHGVADLRGRTATERRRALIAVAHPAFRDELDAAGHR